MTKVLFRIAVATAFAMAATSAMAGTDWQGTPEWKFADAMTLLSMRCAGAGRLAYISRDTPSVYADAEQKMRACLQDALPAGDTQFSGIIRAEQAAPMKPLLKQVYSQWLSYMGSINSTTPQDAQAAQSYQDAVNTLRVELQSQ